MLAAPRGRIAPTLQCVDGARRQASLAWRGSLRRRSHVVSRHHRTVPRGSIGAAMAVRRKKLMLLEEEPLLLEITSFRLELLGYEVESFSTADAGLMYLVDVTPDLIAVGYLS